MKKKQEALSRLEEVKAQLMGIWSNCNAETKKIIEGINYDLLNISEIIDLDLEEKKVF